MPSDPFEAELLMMAEAVASGGNRGSDSESDGASDIDDADNCEFLFEYFDYLTDEHKYVLHFHCMIQAC